MDENNNNNPVPSQPIPDELFQRYYDIMVEHETIFREIVEHLEIWRPGLYGFGERHEIPTWTGIQDQLAGSELYMLSKVMNASEYTEYHVADAELEDNENTNEMPWIKTSGRHRVWRGFNTPAIDMALPKVVQVPRFVQHLIYGEGDRISLRVRSAENKKEGAEHNSYSRNPEDIRGQLMLHGGACATFEHEAYFRMSHNSTFKMTERSITHMSQDATIRHTDVTQHIMNHHAFSRMTESAWFSMSEDARFRMADWSWFNMYDRSSLHMTDTANLNMHHNARQVLSQDSLIVMRGNEHSGWDNKPDKWFNQNETENINIINNDNYRDDTHGDHRRGTPHAYTRGGARYVDKINPNQDGIVIDYETDLWELNEKGRWVVNHSALNQKGIIDTANTGSPWKGSPWFYMVGEPQLQMRIRAELFMTQDSSVNMIHTSRIHTRNDSRIIMRGGNSWYDRDGNKTTTPFKYYLNGMDTIGDNGVFVSDDTTFSPDRNTQNTLYELPPEDRYYEGSPWMYMAGSPRFQMRLNSSLFMTETSSVSMWHDARMHVRNDSRIIMRGGNRFFNRDGNNITTPFKYYLNGMDTIGGDGVSVSDIETFNVSENDIDNTRYELPFKDRPKENSPWMYMVGQPRFQMRLNSDLFMTEDTSISMWHDSRIHTRNESLFVMRGGNRWYNRNGLVINEPFKYYLNGMDTIGEDGVSVSDIETFNVSTNDTLSTHYELPFKDRPKEHSPWVYLAGQPRFQMRLNSSLFMTEDTSISMWHDSRIHTRNDSRIIMRGGNRFFNRDGNNITTPFKYYLNGMDTIGGDGVSVSDIETFNVSENDIDNTRYELPFKDRPKENSPWMYMVGQPRFQMRLNANLFMTENASVDMWHDARMHVRNDSRIIMRGGNRWWNRNGTSILYPFKYYLNGMDTIGIDGVSVSNPETFNVSENNIDNTRYELPFKDRPKEHSPWMYMAGSPRFQMRLNANLFMTEDASISMWHDARMHVRNDSRIIMRGGNRFFNRDGDQLLRPWNYYLNGPHTLGIDGVEIEDASDFNANINTEKTKYELPEKDRAEPNSPWMYMVGQPRFQMRLDAHLFMTETTSHLMWHDSRIHTRNDSRIIMRGGDRWYNRDGNKTTTPFKYYLNGMDTIGEDGVSVSDIETFNVSENDIDNTRYELPTKDRPVDGSPFVYLAGQPRFQMRLNANLFMTEDTSISMWHNSNIHTRNDSRIIMRGGNRWRDRDGNKTKTPFKYYLNGMDTIGMNGVDVSDKNNPNPNTPNTRYELPFKDRPKEHSPWMYMAGSPRFQMRLNSDLFMTENASISMWHDSRIHTRNESLFIMRGGNRWITRNGTTTTDNKPFKYYINGTDTIGPDGKTTTNGNATVNFELPEKDRPKEHSPWVYLAGQPRFQMRLNAHLFMTEHASIDMWHNSNIHTRNDSRIIMRGGNRWINSTGSATTTQGTMGPHQLPTITTFYFSDDWITTPKDPWLVSPGNSKELPIVDSRKQESPWFYMAGQPQLQMRINSSLFMTNNADIRMYGNSSMELEGNSRFDMNTNAHLQGTGNGHLHFTNNPPNYTYEYAVGYETHLNAKNGTVANPGQRLLTIGTQLSRNIGGNIGITSLNDLRRPGNFVLEDALSLWGTNNNGILSNPNPATFESLPQLRDHITSAEFHGSNRRARLEVVAHSYDGSPNIDLIQRLTTAPHGTHIPIEQNGNSGIFNRPMTFQRSWNQNSWTPWVKLLDSLDKFDASIIHSGTLPIERGGTSRSSIGLGEMYYCDIGTTDITNQSNFTGRFTTINSPTTTKTSDGWLYNGYDFPKVLIHNRTDVKLPPEWLDRYMITPRIMMLSGRNATNITSETDINAYNVMGVYYVSGPKTNSPFTTLSGTHELTIIKPTNITQGSSGNTVQRFITSTGRYFMKGITNGNTNVFNTTNGWTELTMNFMDGFKITKNEGSFTNGPKEISMHPQNIKANVGSSASNDNTGYHTHGIHISTGNKLLGRGNSGAGLVQELSIGNGLKYDNASTIGIATKKGIQCNSDGLNLNLIGKSPGIRINTNPKLTDGYAVVPDNAIGIENTWDDMLEALGDSGITLKSNMTNYRYNLNAGTITLIFGDPSQMNWDYVDTNLYPNTVRGRRKFYQNMSFRAKLSNRIRLKEFVPFDRPGFPSGILRLGSPTASIIGTFGFDGICSADSLGNWSFAIYNGTNVTQRLWYKLSTDNLDNWRYGGSVVDIDSIPSSTPTDIDAIDDDWYLINIDPGYIAWQCDSIFTVGIGGGPYVMTIKGGITLKISITG